MNPSAVLLLVGLMALPGPREVAVDCDAGGNLATALTKAKRFPGTTIHVQGTCTGSFVVAAEGLSLEGDPTAPAVLQGPEDALANRLPVLDVTVSRFTMSNFIVRKGWIGVHVRGGIHARADVRILDSTFEENYGGVLIDGGSNAAIRRSTFQSNEVGVAVQFGSLGSVLDCEIRDSGIRGLDVYGHSTASLFASSVSGSGNAGIGASIDSSIFVHEVTLSESGDAHAVVRDRSRLSAGRNVRFGSDGDSTGLAVFLDDGSSLETSTGPGLWGDVSAEGGSHLLLRYIGLHGSLRLDAFTDTVLFNTKVDGVVECRRGSDVFCDTGTTASVSGCASAGPPCTNAPSTADDSLRGGPAPPDSGKDFGAAGLSELRSDGPVRPSEPRPAARPLRIKGE